MQIRIRIIALKRLNESIGITEVNDMHRILRAAIVGGIVVMTGCGKGEELKTLSSADLETLLKGNTMEGVLVAQSLPFKQYFGANGITVQMIEGKRTGNWQVDSNNEFCIRWGVAKNAEKLGKETGARSTNNTHNKTDKGQCFTIRQDSQGKYLVYSANLGHAATLRKVVPGNPDKL